MTTSDYARLGDLQLEAVGEDELTEHYNTLPIHDQVARDLRSIELQFPTDVHAATAHHADEAEPTEDVRKIGVVGWLSVSAAVLILSVTGFAYVAGWPA